MIEDTTDILSEQDSVRNYGTAELSEKLQAFYDSKVQESLHRKAECEDLVYNVVHKIIRKVQTVDSRFRANSLVSLGIPYDGIHRDNPTDFEIMLQLSLGPDNALFLRRHKSGQTTRIQPISGNIWEDCVESNSVCISPKQVTRLLRQYVKRAVYVLRKYIDVQRTEKLPENLTNLELEGADKNIIFLIINKNIRVLLLPSVSIPDFRADMLRKDIPSSSHVVAVCQHLSNLPNKDENQNEEIIIDENNNEYISPLPEKNFIDRKNVKVVWKFSFFVAEKNKMRTILEGCRIKLLRILTEIRDNDPRLHKLSPYHLQTMFFHETDRLHHRRDWKDTKIARRFIDLLRAVSAHLGNGVCMNYFMQPPDYPAVNLLEEIAQEDLQQMKTLVDEILENPLEVLASQSSVQCQVVEEYQDGRKDGC